MDFTLVRTVRRSLLAASSHRVLRKPTADRSAATCKYRAPRAKPLLLCTQEQPKVAIVRRDARVAGLATTDPNHN
jgi:hypothetical protein